MKILAVFVLGCLPGFVSPAQHLPFAANVVDDAAHQANLLFHARDAAGGALAAHSLAFASTSLLRIDRTASHGCGLRRGIEAAQRCNLHGLVDAQGVAVRRGRPGPMMASTPPSTAVAKNPEDEDKNMEGWRLALGEAAKGYIKERQGELGTEAYEDNELYTREWASPLWMLTQEPDLNQLVVYLQQMRERINADPDKEHVIRFSSEEVEKARAAFSRMVRRGEMRLHRLCELTGSEIFTSSYSRQSVVVGQRPGADGASWQRFQLVQTLSADELYAQTDLDLGSRQLERFMWQQQQQPQVWLKAALVANFVEYEALKVNWWGVYKCISRIKAEEEIWNKVVDEIFELDDIIKRDKQLRHLSRYVKDVFGMKMVVGNEEQARRVQLHLKQLLFADSDLLAHGVPVSESTRRLEFVEVKDYLTEREKGAKSSGWRALKSVVKWWDTTIEIQIQVLRNYHRERERITKESHSEFKARRDELRDLIAEAKPLFGFYRDLLQWLFQTTAAERHGPPPTFNNVRVELVD